MRSLMLATFAAGVVFAAAPSSAQTFDPSYPFCKRVNSDASSIDCYYTSMAQCREAVRNMSAECIANPFYNASAKEPAVTARPARNH